MFSPLRNRFGVPGVISVIALVFAMLGGAYAANNSSGGGKATASAKAKKGPRGPKGATGPAGPAGAQGPAGANGKDGANGSNGSSGAAGAPGKSVAAPTTLNPGQGGCDEGGISVEVEGTPASKKSVCNGEQGEQGNAGSPWTAGGTLPVGSTETGAYSITDRRQTITDDKGTPETTDDSTVSIGPITMRAAIPFTVPLASALDANHVHYSSEANFTDFDEGGSGTVGCVGSTGEPTAPSGHLCVYSGFVVNLSFEFISDPATFSNGAATSGAGVLFLATTEEGTLLASGTWAVTG